LATAKLCISGGCLPRLMLTVGLRYETWLIGLLRPALGMSRAWFLGVSHHHGAADSLLWHSRADAVSTGPGAWPAVLSAGTWRAAPSFRRLLIGRERPPVEHSIMNSHAVDKQPNPWVQATLAYARVSFLGQWPGAPDPALSLR
jgi:hypothetical protein